MHRRLFKSFNKTFSTLNHIPNDPIYVKMLGKSENIIGLYLNNPKTRNALSKNLLESLKRNIDSINSNHSIKAVILTSNIQGYFCAGADLKERATMNEDEVELFVASLRNTFQSFADVRVPSICAIDGFALGGGLELALTADIRIATKNSTIGLTECSLGLIPGAGGTQRLPRLINISRAKEMIYTAERIDGEKALSIGLVNHVADSYNQLEERAIEIAEKIVKNAPLALTSAKKAINIGIGHDIKTGLEIERLCYAGIIKTEDRIEGLKAFLEKRSPNYKGK